MTTLVRAALTAAVFPAMMTGCVDSNSRTTIGETVVLPAMVPSPPIPEAYQQDGPSLTGLDRSNWEAVTFLVPVDGTHHRPSYADPFFLTDVTRRQRGEYPSLESSLDLDGALYGDKASCQRFEEGFLVPGRALVDAVSIPVRLIGEPQTWEYVSPKVNYQREPVNRLLFLPPSLRKSEGPETGSDEPTVSTEPPTFLKEVQSEDPR